MGRSLHQFQVDLPEPRTTVPSFSAIWLYDDSGIFDGRKPYDLRRPAETSEDVGLIFRTNSSSYFQVPMLYCSCDTTSYIFWPLGEDTLVKSVFLSLLISLSVLRLCRSNEGSSLFRVRSFIGAHSFYFCGGIGNGEQQRAYDACQETRSGGRSLL